MSTPYPPAQERTLLQRRCNRSFARRKGHLLTMLAILLPVLIGIVGLVIDGGVLMHSARGLQAVTDAAATAAAVDLRLGKPAAAAIATAESVVEANELSEAQKFVQIPPTSGKFAGRSGYVEVVCELVHRPHFMPIIDNLMERTVVTRSVAGVADVTDGAAIVVLDPEPAELVIPPLAGLPSLPALIAGLEIEGLGRLTVHGSVLVNTKWGGVDENGEAVGSAPGPPYAVACMPLLPLTRLRASEIRVVGGVDNPDHYEALSGDEGGPLQANRLAVPDPYAELPSPSTSTDPSNVSAEYRGGVTVAGLPIVGPPVTLYPGVYDYIRIVSGVVTFEPGVYIIRGVDPISQTSLSMVAGTVNAQRVMFYITDSSGYSATTGDPDDDSEEAPPPPEATGLVPSVVIQGSILGSGITALDDPSSPFNGILLYQRRQDRRPIIIVQQSIVGTGDTAGTIYAKWGHVTFLGNGKYDLRFVCGTLRLLTLFDTTLAPSRLLPPARDVLLVE